MEKKFKCENCPYKANYENNPKSVLGRFWHWHIKYCPGWKDYFAAQTAERQEEMRKTYNYTK